MTIATCLRCTLVSCLLALAPWARAASLDDYLGHVDALSAKFEQQLYDTNTQSKETSKGTIAVHSPNKFRLVYTEPYKQIYVADGENLWSYDEDLEQVTVKRQKNLLANSPAMVLSNPGALDQAYEVKDLGTKKGITWFDLKPKSEDSGFDDVRLGFAGKNLYVMQLKDSFGQMTQLRFSQLQYNPKLPSDTFEFTPPQGVDVIRDNPEAQH